MDNENKSVTVIIRETPDNKQKLWNLAKVSGFSELSEFIREGWRKWIS